MRVSTIDQFPVQKAFRPPLVAEISETLPLRTVTRAEAFDYRPSEDTETDGETWNVVLLDDDDHTYPYVIEMLHRLFGHDVYRALALTQEVDSTGRVVVFTGSKRDAEWGRDAIHSYGADPRLPRSRSSMAAIIESVS